MDLVPLRPEHAPDCARIFAAARPEAAWSTARIAALAADEPPRRHLVAVAGDARVLGFATLGPDEDSPGPGRYELELLVDPRAESRGVGRALAANILNGLEPAYLRVCARSDHPYAETWIRAEGFRDDRRHFFVSRSLAAPLPSPGPAPADVEVASLAELLSRDGAARVHARLLELVRDFTRDIPGAEDAARGATVDDLARNLANPSVDPALYLIAATGERYVGKSDLRRRDDPRVLDTGSTGVARDWRRRGLARHLKLAGLALARERDAAEVVTANDETNVSMRALNLDLGFRPCAEVHTYVRER